MLPNMKEKNYKQLNKKNMKFNKSYETETIYDVAIQITNYLIELGYVKDCTDTDDMTELLSLIHI